jgi:hypothetical protein
MEHIQQDKAIKGEVLKSIHMPQTNDAVGHFNATHVAEFVLNTWLVIDGRVPATLISPHSTLVQSLYNTPSVFNDIAY